MGGAGSVMCVGGSEALPGQHNSTSCLELMDM